MRGVYPTSFQGMAASTQYPSADSVTAHRALRVTFQCMSVAFNTATLGITLPRGLAPMGA
ncbi:MAG: hypothetical protein BWY76_02827 [bacterium ADurb.Bin429]|nr:MAG: hypothetical protein BWY76_02827 [bacterium ADurb.Bin429]